MACFHLMQLMKLYKSRRCTVSLTLLNLSEVVKYILMGLTGKYDRVVSPMGSTTFPMYGIDSSYYLPSSPRGWQNVEYMGLMGKFDPFGVDKIVQCLGLTVLIISRHPHEVDENV